MSTYASGRRSNAICDICGFQCRYTDLRDHITNQQPDGLRVCPDCYDVDNPQLQVGRVNMTDPQALYKPRPDSQEYVGMRSFAAYNPVIGFTARVTMGLVTFGG